MHADPGAASRLGNTEAYFGGAGRTRYRLGLDFEHALNTSVRV